MQAASGNYKPRSLVDESAADEPMDADMEEHSKISTEQSDVSSSCVCSVHFYLVILQNCSNCHAYLPQSKLQVP